MKTLILCLTCISLLTFPRQASAQATFSYGRFGTLTVYQPTASPKHVVLFVSGDGGWNLGVVDMAQTLRSLDSLVIGINITKYLAAVGKAQDHCTYFASDFENLSHFVEKKFSIPDYQKPILIGYSSGATLVYTVLSQAPPGTFQGALSMGFCPDLDLPRPPCKWNNLDWTLSPPKHGKPQTNYVFPPTTALTDTWVAFQGDSDRECFAQVTEAYVKKIPTAKLVLLPKVGHGFSVQKNWLPQFKAALAEFGKDSLSQQASTTSQLSALPLIALQVPSAASSSPFVIMLSGDGGWAGLDRSVAAMLNEKGLSVVGLDTLRYFWTKRTPDEAGKALEDIIGYYTSAWHHEQVILVGYSLGAEVMPFMASRFSASVRARIRNIVLLGPSDTATFEFHLTEWLGVDPPSKYQVLPEINKLKGLNVHCVYGSDEEDSVCKKVAAGIATAVKLSGGHHFNSDYAALVKIIAP